MRAKLWLPVLILLFALAATFAWSVPGVSYSRYSGTPGCDDCHTGFGGFGESQHDMHLQMTSTCNLCHVSNGDNPSLKSSGGGSGCIGCHVGDGLLLHHAAAEVPADGSGFLCTTCHPGDPAPAAEGTLPPYYGQTGVNLTSSCETNPSAGGEDYDGDGKGLDNDGDLAYDGDDPDCSVPVDETTWGGIKALYP